jgi:colanic acid biosynthesis protein WcaH
MTKKEFEDISTKIPMVNVDLLVENEKGEILLSWRDDEFYTGWHFPGRCIRFKETMEEAVANCLKDEIGVDLDDYKYNDLVQIVQTIHPTRRIRGHFISFLYSIGVENLNIDKFNSCIEHNVGTLKWFSKCPDNLLECQKDYRHFWGSK